MSLHTNISIYFLDQKVGVIDSISVDMPWLYASIVYEDLVFRKKVETITHFLFVFVEKDTEGEGTDVEDKQYLEKCTELGITDEDIGLFNQIGWELRRDDCVEKFYPHSFENAWMQWRGPSSFLRG